MAPSVQELADALGAAWAENTRRVKGWKPRQGPRDYLTASNLSECGLAMALDLLHPEDNPPFDDDTLERFYRGDDAETALNARLHHVGMLCQPPFKVHGQQREVEIFARDGKTLLIRGKVEGTLEFYTERIVVDYEIKSGQAVEHVETLDDMLRGHWTRKYVRQFVSYLYAQVRGGRGSGLGIFVLDRPGLPVLIPIDLAENDQLLELAENTLTAAEWAVEARFQAREMPPFTADQGLCRRCVHLGKSCHPSIDFGLGAQIDDDPVAASAVGEYLETKEPAARHERAKRYLFGNSEKPGRYRERPLVLVAGEYIVEGRWGPYTRYEVPEEIKAQHKVVDPKGQWKTTVTKLASSAKD